MIRSKVKLTLLIVLSVFLPKMLQACDCAGSDSFCKNVGLDDYCVMLKVGQEVESGFFEFEVIENLVNEVNADKIILQSSTGWNCNASLSQFAINDTVIFNLWDAAAFSAQPDNIDYVLTFCGVQYLSYANGMVTGAINDGVDEMDYQTFKDYIGNCAIPEAPQAPVEETILFPNPTNDQLTINSAEEVLAVELFDMTGRRYLPEFEQFSGVTKTTVIDLATLPRGMYYVRLYGLDSKESFKVVKE